MGYNVALDKGWEVLEKSGKGERFEARFLADAYSIDLKKRQILSLSCNVPAPDHISILILHYLINRLEGVPDISGKWITFQELPGGQGYYDAFKKRAIDPLIRKYGDNPKGILKCLERLPAKKTGHGDAGIIVEAFEKVPVLVTVWGKDEEFSADANIHFDESVSKIFCTEDVAVLADIVGREV